ncbi:unnamed protein product [Caenorhabditis sp. 36 PRJEB53466]|nr:unnamed protein product [Caenorhabditis sp. 36 PRJEB53466]
MNTSDIPLLTVVPLTQEHEYAMYNSHTLIRIIDVPRIVFNHLPTTFDSWLRDIEFCARATVRTLEKPYPDIVRFEICGSVDQIEPVFYGVRRIAHHITSVLFPTYIAPPENNPTFPNVPDIQSLIIDSCVIKRIEDCVIRRRIYNYYEPGTADYTHFSSTFVRYFDIYKRMITVLQKIQPEGDKTWMNTIMRCLEGLHKDLANRVSTGKTLVCETSTSRLLTVIINAEQFVPKFENSYSYLLAHEVNVMKKKESLTAIQANHSAAPTDIATAQSSFEAATAQLVRAKEEHEPYDTSFFTTIRSLIFLLVPPYYTAN